MSKDRIIVILFVLLMLTQPSSAKGGREEESGMSLFGVLCGVGVFVVAPYALPLLGFTGAGIAGGSLAAGVHSCIGNVAAGSAFAALQSAGAGGMGVAAKFAVGKAVQKMVDSGKDED